MWNIKQFSGVIETLENSPLGKHTDRGGVQYTAGICQRNYSTVTKRKKEFNLCVRLCLFIREEGGEKFCPLDQPAYITKHLFFNLLKAQHEI